MGMGMGMAPPEPDAFQPHSPMPPVPRIPSMYGREAVQGFNGGGAGAGGSGSGYFPPQAQAREAPPPQLPAKDYEPQPSRGRPLRAAPTQVPPQGQGQVQQQSYAPPSELVNLGLASRHGRLDERWTSFMHENGFV